MFLSFTHSADVIRKIAPAGVVGIKEKGDFLESNPCLRFRCF